ncbi:ATP-dependent Clp protease proteolytic subunit [Pelagovum pacificum]|uniref:Clp protease n=1 Tax=Pelagovum pacificum TaxID=2588711 RepID=A0A5C5GD95_9RHOB|nr:ATP-dependent Clp protease proteolytic subunit [Pelagovum pacificum]QQA44099.1 hypothetical protein I8N54_05850 [Pelagovum pacificum]TNY32772.1 hypothetical protein FHY64_05710 [Pelagovum pacificum]
MADATQDPPKTSGPGRQVKRTIMWILWVQVGLATVLFGSDFLRILPELTMPSSAPEIDEPLRPGDQTRRYRPADLELRTARPGSRPIPVTEDMPSRLLMESTTWETRPTLTLTGRIEAGDAERLSSFLTEATTQPELVYLNSPGGSVSDALAIGRQLRGLEVETRMTESDICMSACPYILASGTVREVEEGAMVGVHQHFFGENTALPAFLAVEDIQRGQGAVMEYLDEMGIDPMLMQPALITPPGEIYLLTQAELESYRLITTSADEDDGNSTEEEPQ